MGATFLRNENKLNHMIDSVASWNGLPGQAQICLKAGGTLEDWAQTRYKSAMIKSTLAAAISELESGRGDSIFLSAESHTQSAALTWDKNISRLVGLCAPGMLNNRARIGHDAIVTPLITVSGYGNYFENIYLMYGMAGMSATATPAALVVTGNRNVFKNCHFGGPMDASLGDNAALDVVRISGQENYFKSCVFGVDTIMRSDANSIVAFASGSARNMFEDCVFLSAADNAGAFMIEVGAGCDRYEYFKNCTFIAYSANMATALTYAVSKGTTTQSFLFFDHQCSFLGCTDIIATARVAEVFFGTTTTTAASVGLAINPAVS